MWNKITETILKSNTWNAKIAYYAAANSTKFRLSCYCYEKQKGMHV